MDHGHPRPVRNGGVNIHVTENLLRCSKCGEWKPPELFVIDRSRKTGRSSWCRKCHGQVCAARDAANPEGRKQRSRNYYARTRDARAAHARAYRRANPDLMREQRGRTRLARRASEAARRARRRTTDHGCVTASSIAAIGRLYGNLCAYCPTGRFEEIDHVVPLSRGGVHCVQNLAPACQRCNRSKHNLTILEFLSRGIAA